MFQESESIASVRVFEVSSSRQPTDQPTFFYVSSFKLKLDLRFYTKFFFPLASAKYGIVRNLLSLSLLTLLLHFLFSIESMLMWLWVLNLGDLVDLLWIVGWILWFLIIFLSPVFFALTIF